MAKITLTLNFAYPINVSLQPKPTNVTSDSAHVDAGAWDIIYFKNSSGTIIRLGDCLTISSDRKSITVYADDTTEQPANGNFIFFGKNEGVGMAGVTGYYFEVEMKNETTDEAELFAVSSELFESSK
tara:strand:- start:13547 stop:13927 length:381 start_codon:yes stop_codon:yes gene_type:complete